MFRLEWNRGSQQFADYKDVEQFLSEHPVADWVLFHWVINLGWTEL
jgi:hypothetical protein